MGILEFMTGSPVLTFAIVLVIGLTIEGVFKKRGKCSVCESNLDD